MSRVGRDFAGITLRLAVGTVLIWAGLGKCCHTMPVQGERAAVLANLGVIAPAGGTPKQAAPAPSQESTPPAKPAEKVEPKTDAPAQVRGDEAGFRFVRAAAATPAPKQTPPAPAATPTLKYSAEDFPEPVQVKRWAGLVLIMHDNQINAQQRRIVPGGVTSNGPLMKNLALAVSWIELVSGFALLLGAMTRLAGLLGAFILGSAMWLTQLGPALGSTDALLGVIPNPHLDDPGLATTAWAPLMLQLLTFACCLSLVLLGPGRLSLDHWFWGEKPTKDGDFDDEDDEDDDE